MAPPGPTLDSLVLQCSAAQSCKSYPRSVLRIGFDTSPLGPDYPMGVRRVTHKCLLHLERRGRMDVVRLHPPAGMNSRRWRQISLPQAVKTKGLVGIHSFVSAFALRGEGKRVQTLHEAPWKHGVRENADLPHRLWASLGARRADAIVTPTQASARDLGLHRGSRAQRLHTISWGADPPFGPLPPVIAGDHSPGSLTAGSDLRGDREQLLARYYLPDRPMILCPGAVRRKKNLAAVITALAHLNRKSSPPLQLLVTGPDTPDLRRDLGLAQGLGLGGYISTLGTLDDRDLAHFMGQSAAVIMLSNSEGFGLPVLEAKHCGTPAIVPHGAALQEVAGPLAITVDPSQPESVAAGMLRALATCRDLRPRLIAEASPWTWDRTAAAIEVMWESIT